jgi:hypothetical protein
MSVVAQARELIDFEIIDSLFCWAKYAAPCQELEPPAKKLAAFSRLVPQPFDSFVVVSQNGNIQSRS